LLGVAWCGLGVAHRFGKKKGYLRGIKVFLFFGVDRFSWPGPEKFVFNTIHIVYN